MTIPLFIPTTPEEMRALGWHALDVILVTGDTYIDSPHIGVAVIGKVLLDAGYRVGIIAQPDTRSGQDIARLGVPELFWGVTAGCVDSMVANITPSGKPRKSDDLTPGGRNAKRPRRALIVYSNLIRRYFKDGPPIVLGGIEASLRRISHYDMWSDSIRRSVLLDAKAHVLVFGMGEKTAVTLADCLRQRKSIRSIRGICYISPALGEDAAGFGGPDLELPSHGEAAGDKDAFARMFRTFYENSDPLSAVRMIQRQDTRYLVHNPPALPLSVAELDHVHELPFARDVHPFYAGEGHVPALDTIRFSLTTHRGCYGECRFCAIAVHQGRQVVSRSEASLLREAQSLAAHPAFKGIITDVGGPTANMYGFECARKSTKGACRKRSCLFPAPCRHLAVDHNRQIRLLEAMSRLPAVRRVFVASGIRHDLVLADRAAGERYLQAVLHRHTSGQLKIAPEHTQKPVLDLMGKPGREQLEAFLHLFARLRPEGRRKVFLTYYLMAAHPGCTLKDMHALRAFALRTLKSLPEQVQIFTPTPSTYSTLMYHTGIDPFSGKEIFVESNTRGKELQKQALKKESRHIGPTRKRAG